MWLLIQFGEHASREAITIGAGNQCAAANVGVSARDTRPDIQNIKPRQCEMGMEDSYGYTLSIAHV